MHSDKTATIKGVFHLEGALEESEGNKITLVCQTRFSARMSMEFRRPSPRTGKALVVAHRQRATATQYYSHTTVVAVGGLFTMRPTHAQLGCLPLPPSAVHAGRDKGEGIIEPAFTYHRLAPDLGPVSSVSSSMSLRIRISTNAFTISSATARYAAPPQMTGALLNSETIDALLF